jgi:hypothetical protein
MTNRDRRLSVAAGSLMAGGCFLVAAALFHFLAAPHIPGVLRKSLDARAYAFLEPIVSFTFILNAVLLLPLAFSTLYCAAGIRRGERWAWRIGFANALAVLALPCVLVSSMGFGYFADAPLFLAGALSVTAAALLMLLSLLWARKAIVHDRKD